MKTSTITAVVAAALSLSGCASTNTMTNRDQTYSGHPSRIFIVSNLGKLGDPFENELQRQMLTDIQGCGGAAVFERVNPTELSSNERRNRVEQFKADIVLTMQLTSWETQDGAPVSANIDSKIWDVSTKKVIWRGSSAMHMGTLTPGTTTAASLFKELMPKLRADGMIPVCGGPQLATTHNNP